ncbi:hypothetical protein RE476_09160 [Methanolobus mangrovi]|uniref:Uncharacterized protein n=1 Tax=Methanolobus mangrovi TaxID=3072977 RepID=A0AA51UE66_9EURY|nr:hypothetical protein [Methanolobus mangrovi]WMW21555.1 hypothetical protein RE476_09160 [Methanolobus mangrovi]
MNPKITTQVFKTDSCAQLHTLEALMALIIITGIIIFTVQATSLTPLTSSTANAHIEAQLQTLAQDMLTVLDHSQSGHNSSLKEDILNWDGDEYAWNSTAYHSELNNTLTSSSTEILKSVIVPKGIAHNVEFAVINDAGAVMTLPYIYNGEPSDNAVTVSRRILLSNSDISNSSQFQSYTGIADADTSTDFYNLIDVKMTLWRM